MSQICLKMADTVLNQTLGSTLHMKSSTAPEVAWHHVHMKAERFLLTNHE